MPEPRRPCPPPPAQIAPFVQALGLEAAVRFLMTFGGAPLDLPSDPRGRSRAEAHLGRETVIALASHINLPRRIPLSKPWLAAYLHSSGLSVHDIARTLRATDVTVRRWLAKEAERAKRFER
jgi:hypothetical protein